MAAQLANHVDRVVTVHHLWVARNQHPYIVQVALGDLPHGSIGYQTIFAAGLTLLLITLVFNILGQWLRSKFRESY